MIVGDPYLKTSAYSGYLPYERNYDNFLFKRRTKAERQKRKEERKQQRQDPAKTQKGLIPGLNILHGKSKKNPESTPPASTIEKKEAEQAAVKNAMPQKPAPAQKEIRTGPAEEKVMAASAMPGRTEEQAETKAKKEAGFGPALGFTFLGVTILIVGIVLYKSDRKSKEILQPLKVAA